MPTYIIADQEIETDKPLTDSDIEEIYDMLTAQNPQQAKQEIQQPTMMTGEQAQQHMLMNPQEWAWSGAGYDSDHPALPYINEQAQKYMDELPQLNGSLFILIAILFLFFHFLFKISVMIGTWREKFKQQDMRIDKTENLSSTVIEIKTKIDKTENLSSTVIEIKTKIDLIHQYTNPHKTLQSHSPVSLTPLGESIKNRIDGDAIFAKYESQLCKLIEKTNTKNTYDIQVESFKIVKENLLNMLDEKELIAIKDEAYNKGIIIDDVIAIFGVLLRNCILQKKGIPIADVDKHEPQNPK
ncbi:MAG: hypothetical protein LE178_02400 [Endomicrobium sp.]|nr:hypothetical protein [Endomicrobium sp.]